MTYMLEHPPGTSMEEVERREKAFLKNQLAVEWKYGKKYKPINPEKY